MTIHPATTAAATLMVTTALMQRQIQWTDMAWRRPMEKIIIATIVNHMVSVVRMFAVGRFFSLAVLAVTWRMTWHDIMWLEYESLNDFYSNRSDYYADVIAWWIWVWRETNAICIDCTLSFFTHGAVREMCEKCEHSLGQMDSFTIKRNHNFPYR